MSNWYAAFPREEYQARFEKAQKLMQRDGIDAMILTSKENVVYFSGIETVGWDSKHRPLAVVLPATGTQPAIIIAETLEDVAKLTSWIDNRIMWGGWRNPANVKDPITGIAQAIGDLGLSSGTIALERGYGMRIGMSLEDLDLLLAALPQATIADCSDIMWELRMIKSPREIELMRKVCADSCEAFRIAFEAVHPGMTEMELMGIVFTEMSRLTHCRPAFLGIRSGKEKYPMINVMPFDKPMEKGDLIVVDGGASYRYYNCDFMRMLSMGEPTDEQKRFYAVELESQSAGVAAMRPGATAHDVCKACLDVLDKHDFRKHAPAMERIGHGLGLDVHEPPSMALGSEMVLQPGMILTSEPIFSDLPHYQLGNFAIEDVVLITETGHEVLTPLSKELYVVKC